MYHIMTVYLSSLLLIISLPTPIVFVFVFVFVVVIIYLFYVDCYYLQQNCCHVFFSVLIVAQLTREVVHQDATGWFCCETSRAISNTTLEHNKTSRVDAVCVYSAC